VVLVEKPVVGRTVEIEEGLALDLLETNLHSPRDKHHSFYMDTCRHGYHGWKTRFIRWDFGFLHTYVA
jgi:hypothetical protein